MAKSGGREKGTPNKTTQQAKEDFQKIMEGEVKNVQTALKEIYKGDKKAYLYVLSKYFPYFLPRQSEIDISIENNELPFNIEITHRDKKDNPE